MYKRCSDKSQIFKICSPGAYEFSGTNRRSERVRGNILQPSTTNGLTRPKWSQLRFSSQVGLAPRSPAPAPCRLLQPTMPCGSRKVAHSWGQVVPPPCANPHSVQCRHDGASWLRPRERSRGIESLREANHLVPLKRKHLETSFQADETSPTGARGVARCQYLAHCCDRAMKLTERSGDGGVWISSALLA